MEEKQCHLAAEVVGHSGKDFGKLLWALLWKEPLSAQLARKVLTGVDAQLLGHTECVCVQTVGL